MIYKRKERIKTLNKKTEELSEKDHALEDLHQWVNSGVDFENRILDINLDIDEHSSNIIRRSVLKFMELDSTKPITIQLSTYGGEIIEMFSIIDLLKSCPCPIVMVASGKIMSAGLSIFLCGDIRLAQPSTRFMMHSLSHNVGGKLKDTEIDVKEANLLNNRIIDFLSKNTKKNKKWWEEKTNSHDFYFGVDEAKEIGILREQYTGPKGKFKLEVDKI